MTNGTQDKMTDAQYEEQLGLDASQKSTLEAAGLTKVEIRRVNAKRIAEAIAKQRERLDRIESRIKEYVPDKQTSPQSHDDLKPCEPTAEEAKKLYEMYKDELKMWGEKKPWDGKENLIYTNKDYWTECAKVLTPEQLEIPSNVEEMTDDEFDEYNRKFQEEFSNATNAIYDRRRMGYIKAKYEWIKGGCKGAEPEGITSLL